MDQEKINKLYQLLNELTQKKQEIENELNELKVQQRIIEENIKNIEEKLKNEYQIDIDHIDEFLNKKIKELDEWIIEAEEILNQL